MEVAVVPKAVYVLHLFVLYYFMRIKNIRLKKKGYSDADWAGQVDDRRSTSGYVFFVAGGPVSWQLSKDAEICGSVNGGS